MFTKQELKDLSSYVLEDACFVSLYLNVDPKDNPKDDWQLHFKNLSKDAIGDLSMGEACHAQDEIAYIDKYLSDRPEGLKRGLAVISSKAKDFWRVYHTAVPFRNEIFIDKDPYIKPLALMLDQYSRYLIVLVGRQDARLLIARMGEIEEVTAIQTPKLDVNRSRDGGTGDMGAERAQNKMEKARHLLLKDAISTMERVLNTEGIKRVLLGGSVKARGHFKGLLSDHLKKNRLVGEFSVDINARERDILELCLPVMKEVEYKFERVALDELFDQAGNSEGSVLGLSDVLTALQQGNIKKLFVLADVITPGMVCTKCGALTPERERSCPYCEGEMDHVPHMLDLAIQKALHQKARVDILEVSPRLSEVGGIGALLRF